MRNGLSGALVFDLHPEWAQEFAADKNPLLDPERLVLRAKAVWWRCVAGHEWAEKPLSRHERIGGCRECASRHWTLRAAVRPFNEVMAWWDDINPVSADSVTAGSAMVADWRCTRGHRFRRPVRDMTGRDSTCPHCSPDHQ